MGNRVRTINTEEWCRNKNIEIDSNSDKRGIYGFFVEYTPNEETCIYIGKAINIKSRVYEHFSSVKWLVMGLLSTEASEHIKCLADAINRRLKIKVKVLETVEYEYKNYNRDLHHLAYLEYKYIEEYQKAGQCLRQMPEGKFNQKEYDNWQEEHLKNNK